MTSQVAEMWLFWEVEKIPCGGNVAIFDEKVADSGFFNLVTLSLSVKVAFH